MPAATLSQAGDIQPSELRHRFPLSVSAQLEHSQPPPAPDHSSTLLEYSASLEPSLSARALSQIMKLRPPLATIRGPAPKSQHELAHLDLPRLSPENTRLVKPLEGARSGPLELLPPSYSGEEQQQLQSNAVGGTAIAASSLLSPDAEVSLTPSTAKPDPLLHKPRAGSTVNIRGTDGPF